MFPEAVQVMLYPSRYKRELEPDFSLVQAVIRMQSQGIRLGDKIMQFAVMHDN